MAINSLNLMNSRMRLTGLGGSGLDTDTIVKQLMDAERIPLTRLLQKKQAAEWKQEAYRDITNKLRELKDTYFNLAKPASNLMSTGSFQKYIGTSSDSKYVTVSGSSNSVAGSHTVTVLNLATSGKAVSSKGVTGVLQGGVVSDFNLSGKTISITLDGVTREISLGNYSSLGDDIVTKAGTGLQDLVDKAFGTGKIVVSYNDTTDRISFDTANGASRLTLSEDSSNDGLAALGFNSGATNRIDTGRSLESLSTYFANGLTFNAEGKLKFTINSKEFTFDKSVSLSSMMNTINADADAKVNINYDEVSDKFVITAKQQGYGNNINIGADQEGNFFGAGGASGILTGNATTENGVDAAAIIDGQRVTRSSNTFTLNGVTYTLVKAHANPATDSETVSLTADTQKIFDNIKSFVDKYNDLISYINTKLTEKYDRNYQPLTDEQKEGMSEEEIKKWESKAKTGLLKNDPILESIVYNMRKALSDPISGLSVDLSSIGIKTGNYSEKGKLTIDEDKLKAAIENNPDIVSDLFTKRSGIDYSASNSASQRAERYSNQGFAHRISDILNDNIRTVGGKGVLLQKAGMEGDATQYDNILFKQIDEYDDDIDALTQKLIAKEDAYYAKFSALEEYIYQMSVQSDWIYSQFTSSK